jgi:pre-mRNA-splicing factor 38A
MTQAEKLGGYSLTHFDEFIDELLTQERVCDIILPRLTQRAVLEESEGLEPRKSLLVSPPPRSRYKKADKLGGRCGYEEGTIRRWGIR